MNKELILKFIKCEISWDTLNGGEKNKSYLINTDDKSQIQINHNDVINAINKMLSNNITKIDLLNWVNVIRFSDCFSFENVYHDSIISILDRIEESDEKGSELFDNDYKIMIDKLNKNIEW